MGIEDWSTTASENDDADASINWLENQAPSTVNNSARAMMAATRVWYDDYEWRDLGHMVTYATTTTFTVATDVTAIYTTGRPIRCEDSSTLYGYVASSSYGAPNTTVTVTLDSGSLSVSLSSVALGSTKCPHKDVPNEYSKTQNFNATTLTDGATINWDLSENQAASVTLAGDRTLANPTNKIDGATYILKIIQDSTGTRLLTFSSDYKFPSGVAPILSTGNGEYDIFSFYCDGTNMNGLANYNFS